MKTLTDWLHTVRPIVFVPVALLLAAGLSGCHRPPARTVDDLRFQIRNLQREKAHLRDTIDDLRSDLRQCRGQVETLQSLDPEIRDRAIATVQRIEITRRTAIYVDKDGSMVLRAYIRPVDDRGDSIKAPGSVQAELWRLDPDAPEAVLQQWHIAPEELSPAWSGTLMGDFYRFIWPVESETAELEDLTLRVEFKDYLAGRTLTAQREITKR